MPHGLPLLAILDRLDAQQAGPSPRISGHTPLRPSRPDRQPRRGLRLLLFRRSDQERAAHSLTFADRGRVSRARASSPDRRFFRRISSTTERAHAWAAVKTFSSPSDAVSLELRRRRRNRVACGSIEKAPFGVSASWGFFRS